MFKWHSTFLNELLSQVLNEEHLFLNLLLTLSSLGLQTCCKASVLLRCFSSIPCWQYKPPLPGKKSSTGTVTPISSAAKARQASLKATAERDYSSPGQNTGRRLMTSMSLCSHNIYVKSDFIALLSHKLCVPGYSRQPPASPSSRRKQVPHASPGSAGKIHASPSQQRNREMNGTTGCLMH